MRGIYQHRAEKHLHRCLADYDFRCNYRTKLGYDDSCVIPSPADQDLCTQSRTPIDMMRQG